MIIRITTLLICSSLYLASAFEPCSSTHPCQSGGSCLTNPHTSATYCRCPTTHIGELCQFDNPCRRGTCLNSGVCQPKPRLNVHEDVVGYDTMCNCKSGWTGDFCELAQSTLCDKNPCENKGTCLTLGAVDSYTCHCPIGHFGRHCELTDHCATGVCKNGATCVNMDDGYFCKCTPLFTGVHCTEDVDECEVYSGACGDRQCTNLFGSFHCNCPDGFAGPDCNTKYTPCQTSPCENGGTCHARPGNTVSCSCPSGYTGDRCETNIDDCAEHQSANGATCVDLIDQYICKCSRGYQGAHCTEDVDECQRTDACLNGGTCINQRGSYACICVNGFEGDFCQTNANDCEGQCRNGGTCVDLVGNFKCQCAEGFTGPLCQYHDPCLKNPCRAVGSMCSVLPHNGEYKCDCPQGFVGPHCEDIDECRLVSSRPACEHGGTCVNTEGSFRCECAPGYKGPFCEEDVNECEPDPCMNGGTCVNRPASYSCICMSGFTGTRCELDANGLPLIDYSNTNDETRHQSDINKLKYERADELERLLCQQHECSSKAGNARCDKECNYYACEYDGGDCAATQQQPFDQCGHDGDLAPYCSRKFNDQVCDAVCNNENCLFDGRDCLAPSEYTECRHRTYCVENYGNGRCDIACNNSACGYDGGDCRPEKLEEPLKGDVILILLTSPTNFLRDEKKFLMVMSKMLRAHVEIKLDQNKRQMIFAWDESTGKSRQINNGHIGDAQEDEHITGVMVMLTIDVGECAQRQEEDCFSNVAKVAAYLGAAQAKQRLERDLGYPIFSARAEQPPTMTPTVNVTLIVVSLVVAVALILIVALVLVGRKRKVRAPIWLPGIGAANVPQTVFKIAHSDASKADDDTESTDVPSTKRNCFYSDSEGYSPQSLQYTKPDYTERQIHMDRFMHDLHMNMTPVPSTASTYSFDRHQRESMAPHIPHKYPPRIQYDPLTNKTYSHVMGDSSLFRGPPVKRDVPLPKDKLWTSTHMLALNEQKASTLVVEPVLMSEDGNARGMDNQTPLHVAAYMFDETKRSESIEALARAVRNGAKLEARTYAKKETALHMAVNYGRLEAVKWMLRNGANVNEQDCEGNTALHKAVALGNLEILRALIVHNGVALDTKNDANETPVLLACKCTHENVDILVALLQDQASPMTADLDNRTPLHWAAINNRADYMQELLVRGANKDAQDHCDETPLLLAAREGAIDAVKCLLAHGASKDIIGQMDRLPRDVALDNQHLDIVSLLDSSKSTIPHTIHMPATMHEVKKQGRPPRNKARTSTESAKSKKRSADDSSDSIKLSDPSNKRAPVVPSRTSPALSSNASTTPPSNEAVASPQQQLINSRQQQMSTKPPEQASTSSCMLSPYSGSHTGSSVHGLSPPQQQGQHTSPSCAGTAPSTSAANQSGAHLPPAMSTFTNSPYQHLMMANNASPPDFNQHVYPIEQAQQIPQLTYDTTGMAMRHNHGMPYDYYNQTLLSSMQQLTPEHHQYQGPYAKFPPGTQTYEEYTRGAQQLQYYLPTVQYDGSVQ